MLVQLTAAELRELVAEAVADVLGARANDNAPALLTQEQLAEKLGVSTRSIFTLRRQGLPTVMVLESPRFELAAVVEWIKRQTPGAA
jgi:hypothetical protein